jgi:hypothetical protein
MISFVKHATCYHQERGDVLSCCCDDLNGDFRLATDSAVEQYLFHISEILGNDHSIILSLGVFEVTGAAGCDLAACDLAVEPVVTGMTFRAAAQHYEQS